MPETVLTLENTKPLLLIKMPPASRVRQWTFSIMNYTDECCKEMDTLMEMSSVHRLIGGFEIAPTTGAPHIQGCVQFRTVKAFHQVKALLKRAHLDKSGGDWRTNVAYYSKECEVKWAKNHKGGQGERTDWVDGLSAIEEGASFTTIAKEFPAIGRCPRAYAHIREEAQKRAAPEHRDVKITVLWGKTGSGKTHRAMDCDDVYMWHADDKWWPFYEGENRLVIDDFCPSQITVRKLLRILDVYKLRLPIKGSHTYARWTEVFITSLIDPKEWYLGVDERTRETLFSRIDEIIEMN